MDSAIEVDSTITLKGLRAVLKEAGDAGKNLLFFD